MLQRLLEQQGVVSLRCERPSRRPSLPDYEARPPCWRASNSSSRHRIRRHGFSSKTEILKPVAGVEMGARRMGVTGFFTGARPSPSLPDISHEDSADPLRAAPALLAVPRNLSMRPRRHLHRFAHYPSCNTPAGHEEDQFGGRVELTTVPV